MNRKSSVTLMQSDNPKFDSQNPEGPNRPFIYRVVTLVNRVEPRIGCWITESEVEQLIANKWTTVKITPYR